MGHRANLILIDQGRYDLFYTHWGALTLPQDLFWGPEHAEQHIRLQEVVEEEQWLDNIWAEGGCVMDLDRRVLLLFGGEDVYYEVPLRRVWLDLSRRLWEGWDVRWAHRGVVDMAAHVDYPIDRVIADPIASDEQSHPPLRPLRDGECTCVASIRRPNGRLHLYPLSKGARGYLAVGPDLLAARDAAAGMDRLDLGEWTTSFPSNGFHIDVPRKQVRFWRNTAVADSGRSIQERWTEWDVQWDQDAFEVQMELAGPDLLWPMPPRRALEDRIVTLLTAPPAESMVNFIAKLMQDFQAQGESVDVNPSAQREARFVLDADTRRRILSQLLGSDVDAR
jgi:hypothetical protein